MAVDTGGLGALSPIFVAIAACGALVTLSAMWMLIAFSELCCCIRRRREDCQRGESPEEQKYNTAKNSPTVADQQGSDRSIHDSIQYVKESRETPVENTKTTLSKPVNNKTTQVQRSEKKNVFQLRKESKKTTSSQEPDVTMKDRINAFECASSAKPGQGQGKDALKPKKKKPSSKAFQEFERSGIIIGFGNAPKKQQELLREENQQDPEPDKTNDLQADGTNQGLDTQQVEPSQNENNSTTNSLNKLTDDEGIHMMDEEDEFSAVTRQSEILKSFRRAPPPKNRSRANRALQKRISTRREAQNLPGFDFPTEQEEESEGSVTTTVSHSTDSVMSPSDRATPDDDTTTSGQHTGEESPRGTSPVTINRDTVTGKTALGKPKPCTGSTLDNSSVSENKGQHVILLVDNSAKSGADAKQTMQTNQPASTKEVKEVSFQDFMALIQRSNTKHTSDRRSSSCNGMETKSKQPPPELVKQPDRTPTLMEKASLETSTSRNSIKSEKLKDGMPSNQNNNNNKLEVDTNTSSSSEEPGNMSTGRLVLTRPRSFQPINFARVRDSPSQRSNMTTQNTDFCARSRFSSVITYRTQQMRSGAERSRSMSVGAVTLTENKQDSKEKDGIGESESKNDVNDCDKPKDSEGNSFHKTAI